VSGVDTRAVWSGRIWTGVEEGWVRIREGAFGGCDFPPPEQASST
jgi:hypothetical protein